MPPRRHRSGRTLRELRDEAEAAEARGLLPAEPSKRGERAPRLTPAEPARNRPQNQPRLKVVWEVCDVGGRSIATFDYSDKAAAEALATLQISKGKGHHFVRSAKQPLQQ